MEKQNHSNHIRLHLIFSKKIAFAGNNSTGLLFTKYHETSPPLQFSHPKLLCFSFGTPSLGSPLVSLDTAIYRGRWGANHIFAHCGCSSVGHLMIEGFGQLVVSLWFSESLRLLIFGSNQVDWFLPNICSCKLDQFPKVNMDKKYMKPSPSNESCANIMLWYYIFGISSL